MCICEHPHQALLHRPVHVSVRLHGGTDARELPALPAACCPWQVRKRGERALVFGVSDSGDQDGAYRALARADVLVLSKT